MSGGDGKEWLTQYERTLADVNALSDKVRGGGPGARKYNVDRALGESKKKIAGLAGQLTEMELDPPAFGVGEGELNRRRGLMAQLNKLVTAVEDGVSGASSRQRKDLLGNRGGADPVAETDVTQAMSHAELKQATAQQIKQQDDSLDSIARGVTSLKDLGNAMSGELDLHAALLDDLDKHIDKTDNAFRNNTKRIDVVQEEDGSMMAGCGIMLCMLALLAVIIFLASSSSPCHWLPKAKCG